MGRGMRLGRSGWFFAQVMKKNTKLEAARVAIVVPKMDNYLRQYFPYTMNVWIDDQNNDVVLGDILLVRPAPPERRRTPRITFEVVKAAFKAGEIHDPITGRRCKGLDFIDPDRTMKPLEV